MNPTINKQTLFTHFAGNLTALEQKRLGEWLHEPQHRELYYAWLDEWEQTHLQADIDEETALRQFQQSVIERPVTQAVPVRALNSRRWPVKWLMVAASVGLVAGLLWANRTALLYRQLETAYGEVRREVLPDGSVVTLNAHSMLQLPRFGFGNRDRRVRLTGEAAFAVTHQPGHQRFVVQTPNGMEVVVLGTVFNVYARPGQTRVALSRGRVLLRYQPNQQAARQVLMKPGDLARLDPRGALHLRPHAAVERELAWQQHRFLFEKTTVAEIVVLLKTNYNLTVRLKDPHLAERTVSGAFEAKDADEFLNVVAQLLEVNYSREAHYVTLY